MSGAPKLSLDLSISIGEDEYTQPDRRQIGADGNDIFMLNAAIAVGKRLCMAL
jgi:hypothetical protein